MSRHNATNVGYFEDDGSRRDIVCREQTAFDNDAPNTTPLYKKNMEGNQGLLQALELFGQNLKNSDKVHCANGLGREVIYEKAHSKIKIYSVSACHKGKHKIAKLNQPPEDVEVITENVIDALNTFGSELIDDKQAACNSPKFNKNAARHIKGEFNEPNIYSLNFVGRCHNSSTCYVDVDIMSESGAEGTCIKPDSRRRF